MNDLGFMSQEEGSLDRAEELFREALAARRKTLGDKDQSTLTSINNLGLLLQDRGQVSTSPHSRNMGCPD